MLQADVAKCIAPHVNNSKEADLDRVAQVFVAPFSKQQTQAYVAKFAASKELNMDHWSAAQFRAALAASPEVAGLASSPLMLFMVLTILPTITGDRHHDEQVDRLVGVAILDRVCWWWRSQAAASVAACAWIRVHWRWRRWSS